MNKQLYRKFKVMTVLGVDDFASMREVVHRRYRRLLDAVQPAHEQGSVHEQGPLTQQGSVRERDSAQEQGSVTGHDFSRAKNDAELTGALAPAGSSSKSSAKPRSISAPGPQSSNGKEPKTLPSLILIDGGLGQLHAAAEALESLGLTSQPLASIAKKEEVIYLHGNEDEPIVLDRRSPVLHLIQLIRDESHRFAVGYHRQRRAMRDRDSELLNIPGVGPQTRQRLLSHFGSLRDIQQATAESLASVVPRKTAQTIYNHFHKTQPVS
jgi:excinuclease ABC subunit C